MNYIIFYKKNNTQETINRYLSCILYIIFQKKLNDIEYKIINSEDCTDEIFDSCYKYYKGLDYMNNDYGHLRYNPLLKSEILNNDNIKGYNTYGYLKNKIDLNNMISLNDNNGIYVKNINIINNINDINNINNNLNTLLSSNYQYTYEELYKLYDENRDDVLNYIREQDDNIYIKENKFNINKLLENDIISKDTFRIKDVYKIKIIIITLKEYGVRSQSLIENLNELGIDYEIYYGVNGKNINIYDTEYDNIKLLYYNLEATFYDNTKRLNGERMTRGELGAAWSHINIYKKLLKDDEYDNYIILEDDSLINTTIEYFKTILLNLPNKYDIIHIAKSIWYEFNKISMVNDYYYNISKRFFNCAGGYIISKEGANKLLKSSNGWINLPADDLLSNNFINDNINVYVPENYIIYERENNNESLIKQIN